MGILDAFRRKRAHVRGPNLLEVLASVGLMITPRDIEAAWDRRMKLTVKVSLEYPEALTTSWTGELECTSTDCYQMRVSMLRRDAAEMLVKRTNLILTINELCRAKGLSEMLLKQGQSVALCDPFFEEGSHPLYALLQSSLQ